MVVLFMYYQNDMLYNYDILFDLFLVVKLMRNLFSFLEYFELFINIKVLFVWVFKEVIYLFIIFIVIFFFIFQSSFTIILFFYHLLMEQNVILHEKKIALFFMFLQCLDSIIDFFHLQQLFYRKHFHTLVYKFLFLINSFFVICLEVITFAF